MAKINILIEDELRKLVPLDLTAVECIENAFVSLATKPVIMPPILRLDLQEFNGEVDVKTAYVPGLDSFAIKVSPGFFDNPKLGLASTNGLMLLLSAHTGLVETLLFDNGYLTDMRTAAAGAVAAKCLSRADTKRATILGAGMQAKLQLEALTFVRDIESAVIWARNPDKAQAAAAELSARLGFPVTAARSVEGAIAEADIIVTTTPATKPLLTLDMLRPGQHVTAMGSDAEHKNEIDPALLASATYVADSLSQTRILGELHHAIEAGLVGPDAEFPSLGEIVAGLAQGRQAAEDLTLCDLTGTGVQDTAIATLASKRAEAANAGRHFST